MAMSMALIGLKAPGNRDTESDLRRQVLPVVLSMPGRVAEIDTTQGPDRVAIVAAFLSSALFSRVAPARVSRILCP